MRQFIINSIIIKITHYLGITKLCGFVTITWVTWINRSLSIKLFFKKKGLYPNYTTCINGVR